MSTKHNWPGVYDLRCDAEIGQHGIGILETAIFCTFVE